VGASAVMTSAKNHRRVRGGREEREGIDIHSTCGPPKFSAVVAPMACTRQLRALSIIRISRVLKTCWAGESIIRELKDVCRFVKPVRDLSLNCLHQIVQDL